MQQKLSENIGALRIRNEDIDELFEEIFRRNQFDVELGIGDDGE